MKTNSEPTFVETSNIGETKRATIKTSAKLFNFLSGQIYSNKFTAIWRELVANGIDAQKINGNMTPPVVTVPSVLEPYAKVRDFGTGMGHDFMMNQFMAFADASTKEDSNDFIGGFGIGSKAPLSYTDQYSIKCFQQGTVRVYSVFKDDEGCPSIAFLSEDATDEPDGVEVAFPVRQDDITKFTDTVQGTLQYFDPLPVLDNTDLKLLPVNYDAKGDQWGLKLGNANKGPKVVVGGVAYPLNASAVPYDYQTLRNFINLGLDLFMDIGDVEIALSRESVTQDKTLYDKLSKIAEGIGDEFGKQMSKSFANCATEWEAKLKLSEALKDLDYYAQQTMKKFAQWKGKPINLMVERPENFDVLVICYGNFGYNSGVSSLPTTMAASPKFRIWPQFGSFTPMVFDRIVIDNTKDRPSLRIRTVIDTYPNEKILFLRDNSENRDIKWKAYLAALGSPPSTLVDYLSKYTPAVVAKASAAGVALRPFKCYIRDIPPYRSVIADTALPTGGGLYLVMDNFSQLETDRLISVAKMANPKNIVWLNKTDYESSNIQKEPNWFGVNEAIEKVKADYHKKHKNIAMAEAYHRWEQLDAGEEWTSALVRLSKLANFPKRGPLARIFSLRQRFASVSNYTHSTMRKEILGVKYDDQLKVIQALVTEAKTKYPHIAELVRQGYAMSKLSDSLINALF